MKGFYKKEKQAPWWEIYCLGENFCGTSPLYMSDYFINLIMVTKEFMPLVSPVVIALMNNEI